MYNYASRAQGKVIIYLSPKYQSTPPVPFELQTFITTEEWGSRIREITRTASRYSKTLFERIWTITALLATFLIPVILYRVVFDALVGTQEELENNNNFENGRAISGQKLLEARLISFAIFIITLIVFWAPIAIWKYIGRKRMTALIKQWTEIDTLARATGAFVPRWDVKTPGIFDARIILSVTTPPVANPTSFHPDAYLPPYLPPYGFQGTQYPPTDQKEILEV